MLVNLEDVKKIAIGSLFLGGGGGGDIREGLSTARRALELGEVQIIPLSEVSDKEGVILTISGVGSPASDTAYYSEDVYEKILYLIQSQEKKKIIGFIPCEMGASSSFEPFIPAVTAEHIPLGLWDLWVLRKVIKISRCKLGLVAENLPIHMLKYF